MFDNELWRLIVSNTRASNICAMLEAYYPYIVGEGDVDRVTADVDPSNEVLMAVTYRNGKDVRGKPGRLIRKLLPQGLAAVLNDTDYEDFVNILKAHYLLEGYDLVEHTREAIPALIHSSAYATDTDVGTLNRSCMRYDENQEALQFLTTLPEVTILIVQSPGGGVCGRALLWRVNGETFMDRAYGNDAAVRMLVNHAKRAGWWHRTSQGYEDVPRFVNPHTRQEAASLPFTIPIPAWPEQWPYLDTFHLVNLDTRTLGTEDGHLTVRVTTGVPSAWRYEELTSVCERCFRETLVTGDELQAWFETGERPEDNPLCASCQAERERAEAMRRRREEPLVAGHTYTVRHGSGTSIHVPDSLLTVDPQGNEHELSVNYVQHAQTFADLFGGLDNPDPLGYEEEGV